MIREGMSVGNYANIAGIRVIWIKILAREHTIDIIEN